MIRPAGGPIGEQIAKSPAAVNANTGDICIGNFAPLKNRSPIVPAVL